MFSEKDLKIHSTGELFELLPLVLFLGLVAPFLITAYSIGLTLKVLGLLDK